MKDFEQVAYVVISDLWLDEPRVLAALRNLFEKCIAMAWIPKVFILCGSFTSKRVEGSSKELQRYHGASTLGNRTALLTLHQRALMILPTSSPLIPPSKIRTLPSSLGQTTSAAPLFSLGPHCSPPSSRGCVKNSGREHTS